MQEKMSKAYWVSTYRAVKNAEELAAYATLAGPALTAAGGRFLARGMPFMAYELGLKERTVPIEFDSVPQADHVARFHPIKTVPFTGNVFPACSLSATAIHRNRATAWLRLG